MSAVCFERAPYRLDAQRYKVTCAPARRRTLRQRWHSSEDRSHADGASGLTDLLGCDLDVLSRAGGLRDRIAVLAHTLKMKRDGFSYLTLYLFGRRACRNASR